MAVELSRAYRDDARKWPFGAVLVKDGEVIGRGVNRVTELHDPTSHAEINALREAGRALGRHLFGDSVLYSSSEPCPMCLAACYWASIPRIVFAGTSSDLAAYDFQDPVIYAELRRPAGERAVREDPGGEELRQYALAAVREWAQRQ